MAAGNPLPPAATGQCAAVMQALLQARLPTGGRSRYRSVCHDGWGWVGGLLLLPAGFWAMRLLSPGPYQHGTVGWPSLFPSWPKRVC